jgi:hypothetical protein
MKASKCIMSNIASSLFTLPRDMVQGWLDEAKVECCQPSYLSEQYYYGGIPFNQHDLSTHWADVHQFFNWWKNNIERKSKFKILHQDASYCQDDYKKIQR